MPTAPRPPSVTAFLPCCLAYGVAGAVLLFLTLGGMAPEGIALLGCLSLIVGLLVVEYRRPSADCLLGTGVCRARNWSRTGIKLLGLAVTLVGISAVYSLIPNVWRSEFDTFIRLWPIALVVMGVLAPFIFVETDRRMPKPKDAYYQLGRLVLGRWRTVRPADLRAHALGWTVKAFFLPIMLGWFIKLVVIFSGLLSDVAAMSTAEMLLALMLGMFIIDLMGGFIGYAMTFKALGTHIRSVNPLLVGWIAALICYPPFYDIIRPLTRHVEDLAWIDNVIAAPGFWPLAIGIISLQITYTLATVNFGLRFSNLTHRGIVTGGVYRWVKHPAYLSKNAFWWLMSLPFLGSGPEAQWACLCIGAINLIYFVRAKTEERHLMADPAYRAYAAWMEEHGLFAPFMRARRAAAAIFAPSGERPGWRAADLSKTSPPTH